MLFNACVPVYFSVDTVPPIDPPDVIVGCSNDQECPDYNACFNSVCKDPCASDPCATEAFCSTRNHQAQCSCPEGWTGDPTVECIPRKTPQPLLLFLLMSINTIIN